MSLNLPTFKNETSSIRSRIRYWYFPGVYSDDALPSKYLLTYTQDEMDIYLADKANKTGMTDHGNIALLTDVTGDLYDSGVQLPDLFYNILDAGGEF